MATYGGSERNFKLPQIKNNGAQFWTKTDSETKKTTVFRRYPGPLNIIALDKNVEIGTIEKGEDFVPTNTVASGGFDSELTEEERKLFLSDAAQKQLKKQVEETVVEAVIDNGVGPINARLIAKQILDPNFDGNTADPNQSEEDAAAQAAQQGIGDLNSSFDDLANSDVAQANSKTRKGPGSFGDFSYPVDRNQSQDFMKFTLLEYKPKKIGSGSDGTGFGFGGRERLGPNDTKSGRTILGSVSLPIPGGIKDENGADWAGKTMNELDIQLAGIARGITGVSEESTAEAIQAVVGRIGTNNEVVKKAIGEVFAGKAVGVQGLMTRTTGMIFNPNLELLFDKPTLRGFQFTFDLIPRSKKEAEEVVKIIRFFKQGMSPIRSESNLFLLSPNVFQVHYVLNGDGTNDHPYIGKMKECAMTNFAVDYTPQQNYSTLTDGFMTAYKIAMQLKELEPVFNDDYEQNGSNSAPVVPAEIGF